MLAVIASVLFNFMLAIVLIIQEKKEPEFNEWSKKSKNNSLMTNIITLFAIADVEALSF